MKKLLAHLLKRLAQRTIAAYQPRVIGITGSVGKTSTKQATGAALGEHLAVRVAAGNYNNELGLPLAILGETARGRSPFGWMGVVWRGTCLARGRRADYPRVLVLEYGADRKGDIGHLTSIVRPHVAVVTAVSPAHTEFFGTLEDVAQEKAGLIRALAQDGVAVLNADDDRVMAMRHITPGAVVTFGLHAGSDIYIDNVRMDFHTHTEQVVTEIFVTLRAVLHAGDAVADITLHNVVGDAHLYSIVGGVAAALQTGISLEEAAKNISRYEPMPGRMKLLSGIKRTLLLDDSYNASPASVHAALDVVSSMALAGEAKRIVALGSMRELGRYAQVEHENVGRHVASSPVDLLVTVGEEARDIARGALQSGFPQSSVFTYAKSEEAGRFIQSRMGQGDVVLIKGSQAARMEKITKEIMADPLKAPSLLVRQTSAWLD